MIWVLVGGYQMVQSCCIQPSSHTVCNGSFFVDAPTLGRSSWILSCSIFPAFGLEGIYLPHRHLMEWAAEVVGRLSLSSYWRGRVGLFESHWGGVGGVADLTSKPALMIYSTHGASYGLGLGWFVLV